MTTAAILYLLSFTVMVVALSANPEHKFGGTYYSSLTYLALLGSGLALAVWVLA